MGVIAKNGQMHLKIELNHRNELADCFMFIKFPKFQQKFKQAVKIAIQEPNY